KAERRHRRASARRTSQLKTQAATRIASAASSEDRAILSSGPAPDGTSHGRDDMEGMLARLHEARYRPLATLRATTGGDPHGRRAHQDPAGPGQRNPVPAQGDAPLLQDQRRAPDRAMAAVRR